MLSASPVDVLADAQTSTMRKNTKDMAAVVVPWDQHLQAEWPHKQCIRLVGLMQDDVSGRSIHDKSLPDSHAITVNLLICRSIGRQLQRLEWLQHAVCVDLTKRS